ncbi:MAG TPA: hypothetical protein VNP71_10810 [Thermoplasmata archaeon]|nr:hypothetical protein [Thermoplasmata archaeon]
MSEWVILTTERFIRRLRLIYLAAAIGLVIVAILLWLSTLSSLAVISGAAAWAVTVAIAVANYNAKRGVPSRVTFEESGIRVRYLTGKERGISWVEIESIRKVSSGPLILKLRGGAPLTIRTSRDEAAMAVSLFQAHQIPVT